jgi:hypothetical protein
MKTVNHWGKKSKEALEDRRMSMPMDWQNQCCEKGFPTGSNLHVQCNPHQNPNGVLHRDRKASTKVHLKAQKTSNSQSNPEQKDQCKR